MIGLNSVDDIGASGVFLTNLDEIGSLNHSCMHNTNNVPQQTNVKRNNKQKRKIISKPSLRYLDLDDS